MTISRSGQDLLQDKDVNHITCDGFGETFGVSPMLVCGDGGVLEMAYRHATGCGLSTPRRCELPNAALNWIEVGEREWTVLGWADCGHLAAALDDLPE